MRGPQNIMKYLKSTTNNLFSIINAFTVNKTVVLQTNTELTNDHTGL